MREAKTAAIIGGGAAGLAAAVAAAEAARAAGAAVAVVVYEASDRVGRSILATGNGRCNFSNARPDAALYRHGDFVAAAWEALEAKGAGAEGDGAADPGPANAVLRFFADHGLLWREEGEGRLYPLANNATSVLDCLRASCAALGVEERCGFSVAAVEPPRGPGRPFTLRLADGRFERADAVIVAVGGAVARNLLPEGLPFVEPVPTLGPLATETRWCRPLDNIRVIDLVDTDVRVAALSAGQNVKSGSSALVALSVENMGSKDCASVAAEIYKNGTIYAQKNIGSLAAGATASVQFAVAATALDDNMALSVAVIAENDMNPANNAA